MALGNGESQPEVPHNKIKRVHASGPDQVRLVTRPRDTITNKDILHRQGMRRDNDMMLSSKQKHQLEYEGNNEFSYQGQSSPTPPIFDGQELRKGRENMDENLRRPHIQSTQNKTPSHMSSKQRCGPSMEVGTTVILKSSTYPNRRSVAYATILGGNSKTLVGGVELGRQFIQVQVDELIDEDERLVRERENCMTIGDAFASGVTIAWPLACIEKING